MSMREPHEMGVTRLEDYAPPPYFIDQIELTFDLDPARTRVTSRMLVRRNPSTAAGPLELDGEDIALESVLLNALPAEHLMVGNKLVIDKVPDQATLEIVTTCTPDANTQLSGLYTSQGTFFTQCEAQGFRRITYFLDRPDVMSRYKVRIRADKARFPVLLSNGNLLSQRELPGGMHEAVWEDPFPKPSYLFALVAGNLVAREQRVKSPRTGQEHLLQVYVRAGDLDKTDYAMQSLIHSLIWDEQRFGLSLDLERFMIVATSDFNMGAMENKGLNIFNTKYVLANAATATDTDFAGIESVVGHEYFHNWTGNRITCRDWFQLSLKEGLTVFRDQEFSQDMAGSPSARAVLRIEDVRNLRSMQFPEDAGPMAHPVRPQSYSAIDNFYTTTVYEKGAEVVRMYQTLAGRDGFRRGMDLYFQRHDGQAVTCDDFAQCMADANPATFAPYLTQFKRWYSQAGTPRVKARGRYDAASRTYTLSLAQQAHASQPGNKPFVIPVAMGLLTHDGHALPLQLEGEAAPVGKHRVLVLTEEQDYFTFINVDSEPVPSLLRGFSAPVILDVDCGDEDWLTLLSHDTDPFNQWEAAQRLAMTRLLATIERDGSSNATQTATDAPFIEAMRAVLRHPSLSPAFKDLVLTLPSEAFVAEQVEVLDPQKVHRAREAMRLALARELHDDWLWAWCSHQVDGAYSPDPVSAGRRALKNHALSMLCESSDSNVRTQWQGVAYQAVKTATNMTDRFSALQALERANSPLIDQAHEHFYRMFKHEALVVDKWFALQANMPAAHGDVLARVKKLTAHADFTLRNPNRARSLIGQFVQGNLAGFHRIDGAGYEFWADQVIAIDALNPQLAARVARAMDRWKKLASPYQAAARNALERVRAHATLSDNTQEIVQHALEA
jgi:aminopeptidase N